MLEVVVSIKIEGACPMCGDSIQQFELSVRDHGLIYTVYPVWCPDCKSIVAVAVPEIDRGKDLTTRYVIKELKPQSTLEVEL